MPSDSRSILRMFAVRRKGPGGTERGGLGGMFGTAAVTVGSRGFVAGFMLAVISALCMRCDCDCVFFCCSSGRRYGSCGSSSRSSREKARSCVDSGGTDSVTGGDGAMIFEVIICGVGSVESSRAICVPLSRKSSQPPEVNAGGAVG